jgi:hypothetical protein
MKMMALVYVDGPVPVTKFVHKSDLKCKYLVILWYKILDALYYLLTSRWKRHDQLANL